jgi:hypothetical protein
MANLSQLVEGAAAIGGVALEVCGYAAKTIGEKVMRFMSDPKKNTETMLEKCSETAVKAKNWVIANPLAVCGAAFGAGLLLVAHCRCRKRKNNKKK